MTDEPGSADPHSALYAEIENRFGILPNFFRQASESPSVTHNLWAFAKVGYLDNPLPSLFKERLFVYISRFCDVRYCIARHVGFLIGLGRPSGDSSCGIETVDQAIHLLRRRFPRGEEIQQSIEILSVVATPLTEIPASETQTEEALFACATHVFLQTPQSPMCLEALERVFDPDMFQHFLVFLAFVRTAHFWTKVHPELKIEDDLSDVFAMHEELAECVLNDPEAGTCEVSQVMLDELTALRRERDLREQLEQAIERLRDADRRKDVFLATLAHELRNPLAPIRMGLEVMKLAKDDAETLEEVRTTMEQQTKQLTSLVDDLLDVSRITTGKFQLRKSRIDLADVIRSAVDATLPLMEESNHELSVSLPQDTITLEGDPNRLAQVVSNLLNNAAKYSPPGSRIELTVQKKATTAIVSVRDYGLGIAPERQADIFNMFSQIEPLEDRVQQGLGIGLTLSQTLVEMHDGTISVESDGKDHGSRFSVQLPTCPPDLDPDEPSVDEIDEHKRKVLIVDDNKDAASLLSMSVKLLGNEVRVAGDGQQGLEISAEFQPEVVLMDIRMPKLNGYEAARLIREQEWGKHITLIALTGSGQEEDRKKAHEAGFDHHLTKPAEPAMLKKLLSQVQRPKT